MPSKRDVLALLSRDELLAIVDRFELAPPDRRGKDGLVETVASSKKATLAEVLPELSRERLKELCRALDLDDAGKEKLVLVERLTGAKSNGAAAPSSKVVNGAAKTAPEEVEVAPGEKLTTDKLERYLWSAADILRGSIDSSDYKGFIFGMLFLKRLSDRFDEECDALRSQPNADPDDPDEHDFFVPKRARWSEIQKVATGIGEALNKACAELEQKNDKLEGVLAGIDFNDERKLGDAKNRDSVLSRLVQHFGRVDLRNANLAEPDMLGRAYEYLIEKFADDAGKKGGEFYTPKKVVELIVAILEPKEGMRVCDPTCGSGGMLIECAHHLARHRQNPRNLSLFGQEKNLGTWAIARMNTLLHGLPDADIRKGDTIRDPKLVQDGELMLFDRVIANPPFSLDEWGREVAEHDPYGRFRFGVPPKTKGDLAFVQHMVATTNTKGTFGSYIDTYTIEQAVADGATVPIFYEGRLPELRIIGNTLDAIFDRVFADRSDEEREAIKKKYATEVSIATAPKRVEAICLDIIDHYTRFIQPNKFKAQIVTCSREAACLYKETLDRLNAPQSAIIISGSNKDDERLVRHHTSEEERKKLINEHFLKPGDPLSILVVCDMLLTGFDAPVEQVMYLDAPLKEHTLLQAIARVNRTADGKDYGLIVDYWGVSEALQEALAIFAPSDVKGAMTPKGDELPRLQARHAAALRFFVRVKDKDDLDACVAILEPEDVRAQFDEAFKKFAQSLDMMLPDPRALPYVADARWLGKIRATAAAKYRDDKLDISDCGAKVRKLIEEAVIAEGIQVLVKQVSLFTPEFDDKLKALKSDDARASEMEHAIRHEIHVKLEENPAFFTSLRERLQQIIEDRKAKRIDAAQQLKLFEVLTKEMRGHADAAEKLGLSETGFAIYGLLRGAEPMPLAESKGIPYGAKPDEAKTALASVLEEQLEPQVSIVDWSQKDDVKREMRRLIKRQLRAANFAADKIDATAESIVDLMKRRRRT